MALEKFYESPAEYDKVTADGWDERFEYDVYLFDTETKQITRRTVRGRDNPRDTSVNFRNESDITIEADKMPAEALAAFKNFRGDK